MVLRLNLIAGLAVLAVVTGIMPLVFDDRLATIGQVFIFGIAAFAINPALQAQVMQQSSQAPTLASAANISAFNIGNTIGPWLGGTALAAGFGYGAPAIVGAMLAAAALLVSLAMPAARTAERTRPDDLPDSVTRGVS